MKSAAGFVSASLIAGVLMFGLGAAQAQQKIVLKASDIHPTGYPTVVAVESMGKKLERASNGRLSVAMYPSMQLGGEKEAIEQAQVGAIAFARVLRPGRSSPPAARLGQTERAGRRAKLASNVLWR